VKDTPGRLKIGGKIAPAAAAARQAQYGLASEVHCRGPTSSKEVNSTQALPTLRKPSGYSGFLRTK
jgi:hypothetical protein